MRERNKAFVCSVAIHLLLFLMVIVLMRATAPQRKTFIIDFSLGDQPEVSQSKQPYYRTESRSGAEGLRRPTPAKIAEQHASPAKDVVMEPATQLQRVSGAEERVMAAIQEPTPSTSLSSGAGASGYEVGDGSGGLKSFSAPGSVTESSEMRYVKVHFAGIRNAIIKKLSYPRLARRMGWAGTVKVSFIVNEDGGVSNVRVIETSGVELLDNNAIETIRRCSPYPRPPCRAEMVMPITYRLDD